MVHSTDSTLVLRCRRLGPRDGDPILVGVDQHVSVGDGVNRYQTRPACSCPIGNWLWNRASLARFRMSSRAPARESARARAPWRIDPDRHGDQSPTKKKRGDIDLGHSGERKRVSLLVAYLQGHSFTHGNGSQPQPQSQSQLESRPSNSRGRRAPYGFGC